MGEYRKTFVNRIYTVGLTTCGSALVRIAGATESEGFQKVASFVNKWICGGNNTGQTLAEIQALCNEILNEVKIVDQHLKEYDAEIENTLQKIQYTEAKNELNQQWSKDIDVYETAGNVGNTLSAYEDYMKAAQLYMDGKTDINAVEKSKQKLYDNFIEVYKAAGNSFENPTDEKKKDAIFCNDTIDGVFKRSIWSMINALNKPSDEKNYADAAAQFAYTLDGLTVSDYAERFYESHNYGYGPDKDGTILLISMEDHDWYMATYGYAITAFTDAGIQYIGEEMTGDLSDGDFAAAFDIFADECDDFITQAKTGEPYDIDNEPQKPMSWIWIPISLVAGIVLSLIVVGTMKSKLKTVRFQAAANNYVKAGSMNLTESRDIFLYNTMTKTKKEKNDSSSGGGSSTHTTSSGSTAGGGGGKF